MLGKRSLSSSKQPDLKAKKGKYLGNKNLRAGVRMVKRRRSNCEDEEEEEINKTAATLTRVSRSGRTIKVKEEHDFVV